MCFDITVCEVSDLNGPHPWPDPHILPVLLSVSPRGHLHLSLGCNVVWFLGKFSAPSHSTWREAPHTDDWELQTQTHTDDLDHRMHFKMLGKKGLLTQIHFTSQAEMIHSDMFRSLHVYSHHLYYLAFTMILCSELLDLTLSAVQVVSQDLVLTHNPEKHQEAFNTAQSEIIQPGVNMEQLWPAVLLLPGLLRLIHLDLGEAKLPLQTVHLLQGTQTEGVTRVHIQYSDHD